jgi:hypothetical protein
VDELSEWKHKKSNLFEIQTGELTGVIHRKEGSDDRWFLSVSHHPFNFKDFPLTALGIDGAKMEALRRLKEKSSVLHNALQDVARRDSKVTNNFKLRLIAILNDVETIQELTGNKVSELGPQFERLTNTIHTAMSDLD